MRRLRPGVAETVSGGAAACGSGMSNGFLVLKYEIHLQLIPETEHELFIPFKRYVLYISLSLSFLYHSDS